MEDQKASRSYPASALHGRATDGGATCANCTHFQRRTELVPGPYWDTDNPMEVECEFGACRALPPTPTMFGSRRPSVRFNDTCGLFRPRPATKDSQP